MTAIPLAPEKRSRDGAFFGYTRSICPTCKKNLDAHIILRDGRVFMRIDEDGIRLGGQAVTCVEGTLRT